MTPQKRLTAPSTSGFGGGGIAATFFTLSACFLWILSGVALAASEATLTENDKQEKRLQFNRYVHDELKRESQPKAWSLMYTPAYGYDRNVNLDSEKNGDSFYQNTLDAKYQFSHQGWGSLGEGRLGVGGLLDQLNYPNVTSSNYRDMNFSVFGDTRLGSRWVFKTRYEIGLLDYIHDDASGYLNQRIRPTLSYGWSKTLTQNFYSRLEHKDYSSRKKISSENLQTEDDRKDFSYETGTGFRWIADKSKVLGVSAGYKRNDSNDEYLRYNDYEALRLSGYGYFQMAKQFSSVVFAGCDWKRYDERVFEGGSDDAESDHFFYAGNTLYWDWTKQLQVFATYLYKQNNSNDPSQEYSGYTISTGMVVSF